MRILEGLGYAVGLAMAPLVAVGSLVRQARFLHPDGTVYRAEVTVAAAPDDAAAARLAAALAGPALVRLSSAWWKGGKEWLDVLGLAMRLRRDAHPSSEPGPEDQDLLFATIRWPVTTPLAPLTTDQHSFLHNNYHGVSPFQVPELGRVKLRLRSPHLISGGERREVALAKAVAAGTAVFILQARRLCPGAEFQDLAAVRLVAPIDSAELDQEALRFSPFRSGRGIEPVGLVHSIRHATYAASQAARPKHSQSI